MTREEKRAYHREWKRKAAKSPEWRARRNASVAKVYAKKSPAERKGMSLKRNYGITLADFEVLRLKQNGKCAVCGTDERDLPRGLFVDHDHVTNKVRGLLCHGCNAALGLLREDPDRISRLRSYLERKES